MNNKNRKEESMNNNQELASSILQLVGGKGNVSDIFHCMTRLRLNLKDNGLAKLDEIKNIGGVFGTQVTNGEVQIILGPAVENVYNEITKLAGISKNVALNENLDPEIKKEKLTFKSGFNNVLNVFSACMSPLVPLFIVIGVFNLIAILISPTFFNLVSVESDLYRNFYNVGQAIIYFLPMLLAYTASRKFNASTHISLALAGFLLYPAFTALVSAGTPYTVFGLNAYLATYSGSIIPIMLIVWVQSHVERFLNKHMPDSVKIILVPSGTILIMLPLAFVVLGPLGAYIGSTLSTAVFWLYSVAGPIETALYGAFAVLLLATGISRPVFFVAMASFFATGVEYAVMPIAMVTTNWVVMGTIVGFVFKTKNMKERQLGITSFTAHILSGVSEPSIFGIILNHKKAILATIIAGGISGFYVGLMKVGVYAFGPTNFMNVIAFAGRDSGNLINGIIASAIAFVSGFVAMLILYKGEEN